MNVGPVERKKTEKRMHFFYSGCYYLDATIYDNLQDLEEHTLSSKRKSKVSVTYYTLIPLGFGFMSE
jgi:DNA-binding PadR family transcriptional regulator